MDKFRQIVCAYKHSISPELEQLYHLRLKHDEQLLPRLEKLYAEACDCGNELLQTECQLEFGQYFYNYRNDFQSSLLHLESAYQLSEGRDWNKTFGEICRLAGVCSFFLGNIITARQYYDAGIKSFERGGLLDDLDKQLLGSIYFNYTNLYRNVSKNENRLGFMKKAHEIFKEVDYRLGVARCLNSYAIYHPDYVNSPAGYDCLTEAARIFKEEGDKRGFAVVNSNIGSYLAENGDFEQGLQKLKESLALLEELGQPNFTSIAYRQLATAYRKAGRAADAIPAIERAVELLDNIKSKHDLSTVCEEASLIYAAADDYEKAYLCKLKTEALQRELDEFDKKSLLSEERIAFELEEQKRIAEVLMQKNEEIAAYVQKLEAANTELQRFVHITSHDLKEPLRMVSLYVQLLQRSLSNTSPLQIEYMNYAMDGARRMYNLINSLLELNRIPTDLRKEKVNLDVIVPHVLLRLKDEIDKRNARIHVSHLPTVEAEPKYTQTLFENLLMNALLYNDEEQPEIKIGYEKVDDQFRIYVSDNGIGIKPAYREKIFEMFQKLNKLENYEGTGIGLTICKKITENMNGRIMVQDNSPKGSRFIVELPVI